ncbi:hypothetical protein SAMN02745127_01714 [Oceanospirillum multiglobuliferum]|uniref:Aminoglycoside phosphotransferase domain-containing protein n=1 Tax=Oceanospirillum multiglobuliferum TaxID=64969 RepID=A0A1T4Q1H2_9GAMM|nr:phosphotransferase [Oceanospirillum multiglobuliferum]OPX55475.1 hypothetical protein BTE48_08795 [Oceanospirillum multiglobuliferum]SJZ97633.1 hypothetical protein SAMN02745127_01714 [Oceanospirillum multiglobuliferum]
MTARYQQMCQWLKQQTESDELQLEMVAGDASFRRYYRLHRDNGTEIIMDAPPSHEDCQPFVTLAEQWFKQGIPVPQVLAQDLEQGFLRLEDFGDQQFLPILEQGFEQANNLYPMALSALIQLQTIPATALPAYDEALLMREMALFKDWFCQDWLGLTLDTSEQQLLADSFAFLCQAALSQPKATVHRDYHSRNLMLTPDKKLGVIDFQDAVYGPITYDLVSLLRDCYIQWPTAALTHWRDSFWDALQQSKHHQQQVLPAGYNQKQFTRDFDLMGAQRHLKAIGIFARLWLRDGKSGYLKDIPRTLIHLVQGCSPYPELRAFVDWLNQRIAPALAEQALFPELETKTEGTNA